MAAIFDRKLWSVLHAATDNPVRIRLGASVSLAILAAGLAALAPLALKQVVDDLTQGRDVAGALALAGLYLAALGAGRAGAHAQTYLYASADQAFQRGLGAEAFGRLLRMPAPALVKEKPGVLIQLHNDALQGVRLVLSLGAFTLIPALVQLIVILAVVGSVFDPGIWLIVAAAVAGYGAVFIWGARRVAAPARLALAAQADAAGTFCDGLVNAETVRTFGAEAWIGRRYGRLLRASEIRWRRCFARRLEAGMAATAIFVVSMGGAHWLGIAGVGSGEVSVGEFILLNAYLLQIVAPLESAGTAIRELALGAAAMGGWTRILQVTGGEAAARRMPFKASIPERTPPAIRFEDVSFAYEAATPALLRVSFELPAGCMTAIVGPSGSGKSSIVRLLQRHYPPDAGRILIDGTSIGDLDIAALQGRTTVAAQNTVLFNDTLRNNLRIARPGASSETLDRALAAVRLDRLVDRLPLGLDTPVGEKGFRLSGGERQRLAVARAILREADLLMLDEPTSSLDPETERAISCNLIAAARGRTTLIVTHRLTLASLAPSILVLDKGRLVEQGSHQDLLSAAGLYARLWSIQMREVLADEAGAPRASPDERVES